jgi:cytochrome c6
MPMRPFRPVLVRLLAASVVLAAAALPARAADVAGGEKIYRQYCAQCHGASGVAVLPNAPSFARGDRLMQPDPMLAMTIRSGRNAMPAFAGLLNERQIFDVIAYLRTIR